MSNRDPEESRRLKRAIGWTMIVLGVLAEFNVGIPALEAMSGHTIYDAGGFMALIFFILSVIPVLGIFSLVIGAVLVYSARQNQR